MMRTVVCKAGLLVACGVLGAGCWGTYLGDLVILDEPIPIQNDPRVGASAGRDTVEVVDGQREYFLQRLADPSTVELWAEVSSDDPSADDEVFEGFPPEQVGSEDYDALCEDGGCFLWTWDMQRNSVTLLDDGLPAGSLLHIHYDVLHSEDVVAVEPW